MQPSPLHAIALTLALTAPAAAQRPSSWVADATANIPSSAINHLGKLFWFIDQNQVHVFSAATRSWARANLPATAAVRNTNDILLIDDGTTISALSSARGRFDTIQISANGFIVNPPSGRNDEIILVIDGTSLWWFSGFSGRWKQRTISTNGLFAVQRNTALLVDGNTLWGLSALYDTWVQHSSTNPITTSGVGDTVGWASDGNQAHAFSAIRNAWSSAPLPVGAGSTPNSQNDIAIWVSPGELLGFSGVRGRFDLAFTGEQTTINTADHLAHAASLDQRRHWMFSVPQGRWTNLQTATAAPAQLGAATALLLESNQVHGYSAMLAGFASVPLEPSAVGINATVGAVLDTTTNDLRLFSALTQQWYIAPSAARRTIPRLTRNGALLDDGHSAWWAFSARTGNFVPRTTTANPAAHVNTNSSLLAIEADGSFAAFDPRREAWVDTPLLAGDRPLRVEIWRTTLVATTSSGAAIGFGALHGAMERTSLNGAVVDVRASSEVGGVITANEVLGYSPVPDVRTEAQFPEFRRMVARGATVDVKFAGAPGASVGGLIGLPSAQAFPISTWGTFTLDPALLLPINPGTLDSEGNASVSLPIPDAIEFVGLEIGFQALFAPSVGQPYLSRMGSLRISAATREKISPAAAHVAAATDE